MGYETRLHIGVPYPGGFNDKQGRVYLDRVATIDLSKAGGGDVARVLQTSRKEATRSFYWYSDDGDTPFTEDAYDEPLTEVPLALLLLAMIQDNRVDPDRRFNIGIALLSAFVLSVQDGDWPDGIVVVQEGH